MSPPGGGPEAPAWARESAVLRLGDGAAGVEITPDWAFGGSTGKGVRVALVDSGVDAEHPALGRAVDADGAIDFSVGADGIVVSEVGPHGDVFGHGTACAGIVHALAPDARITSVRVLGPSLTGTAAAFHAGLSWAVEEGFDVINLSLGTSKKDWALAFHEVCDRAYFGGSFMVTAANNVARVSYPSLFASVASVACNTSADPLRFHANPQPPTEFLARGIDVEVPWLDGGTTTTTGNSFAAPHIAAFAALVKSKHPELRPFQIKSILWATAANVVEAGIVEAAGRRGTVAMGGARGTAMALVRPSVTDRPTRTATGPGTPNRRRRASTADESGAATPRETVTTEGIAFGDVVGHWRWGAVRVGRRSADGLAVAVRELGARLDDPDGLRAADRAVGDLAHPHLSTMIKLIDDPPAIVSARPHPVDPGDRVAAVAAGLAATAACAAVHDAGLVHGDLGPAWLGPDEQGRARLGGAGLAAAIGAPTSAMATALRPGALAHLAPEQLGDGSPTRADDVYALGLLWCHLLTGTLPWDPVDNLGSFIRQRLATPPRPVVELGSAVPATVAAVIDGCLARDPGDRAIDAGELGLRLIEALAGAGLLDDALASPLLDAAAMAPWVD